MIATNGCADELAEYHPALAILLSICHLGQPIYDRYCIYYALYYMFHYIYEYILHLSY